MGFNFFAKPKSILTEEDEKELRDIQRKAYMDEAKKIMENRGKEMAKRDLELKKPKERF